MADPIPPLHGTKTHPLRPGSIETLRRLARGSVARHLINPGVRNRLAREGLAEEFRIIGVGAAYRITDAGRKRLEEIDNG